MQRFTLIHDGSPQSWLATYLAFHVAARLGASLRVLLVDSGGDKEVLAQRAAQIEIGGRAAGVVIETRIVKGISRDLLIENPWSIDGIFFPRRLMPDGETVKRFLEAVSCPIWIVSKGSEIRVMVVLADHLSASDNLIAYAATLSQRLGQSLTVMVRAAESLSTTARKAELVWWPLPDLSLSEVDSALTQLHADLVVLPASIASLVMDLNCTCVVCPEAPVA